MSGGEKVNIKEKRDRVVYIFRVHLDGWIRWEACMLNDAEFTVGE
jgi:hypothetical protein